MPCGLLSPNIFISFFTDNQSLSDADSPANPITVISIRANTWARFRYSASCYFGIYNYGIRAISKVQDDRINQLHVFSKLFYISVLPLSTTTGIYFLIIFFDTSIENHVRVTVLHPRD